MTNFVTLTKQEFEAILPNNFTEVENKRAQEFIYSIKTDNPNIAVYIYSTIDKRTMVTRDIGMDAIRVIFWDMINNRPIGKGKKILRVQKATTIESRIKNRIDDFMKAAKYQEIVSFQYIEAILEHEAVAWMDFANSLLENFHKYDKLTDNQLSYVLGEKNPKGKMTFEARVKMKDPNFLQNYLNNATTDDDEEKEKDDENEKSEETTETNKTEATESTTTSNEGYMGMERQGQSETKVKDCPTTKLLKTKNYHPYQYPFKLFNPIQSAVIPHIKEDKNMVIGANTSAGKTICAELLMDHVLKSKRVIYLSPLKALTQEKYDDWQKRFSNEKITILTGDYTLTSEMKNKLAESKIIVMTSEMMDSRTRRMESEKNFWLMQAGLVIVDESHILATNRGHAVETGIMRFSKLNPSAKILFLSATMPNVAQLGDWLTLLNKKPTTVLFSNWRPVELQFHHEEYPIVYDKWGRQDYWPTQENKRKMAIDLAMSKSDEKFLIFCHDKATGRNIVKRLEKLGEKTKFHNADLNLSERLETEKQFQDRENGIRILVSTSTLAWGRNLPARNVIVVGIHRGINEVDELDIIQMAGRAGRYGIDNEGHVYLIIPEGTTGAWIKTFASPRPVTSILNNHEILAFHTLAEINNREITTEHDMVTWYSRSLAFMQNVRPFTIEDSKALIRSLTDMEMIGKSGIKLFITNLGKVSAWLYFSPYDIYSWYKNFDLLSNGIKINVNDPWSTETKPIGLDDTTIAWALTDIPSNDMGYIPRDVINEADEWRWLLKNRGITTSNAIIHTIAADCCLAGREIDGLLGTLKRALIFDIDRVVQAISLIDTMSAKWGLERLWEILPQRIKYGIPEQMVELTKLPGIGGKRAKRLWKKDIISIADIANEKNKRKLAQILTPVLASKVHKAAKEMIKGGNL